MVGQGQEDECLSVEMVEGMCEQCDVDVGMSAERALASLKYIPKRIFSIQDKVF